MMLVCTVCICHFVKNFGVQNLRTFILLFLFLFKSICFGYLLEVPHQNFLGMSEIKLQIQVF